MACVRGLLFLEECGSSLGPVAGVPLQFLRATFSLRSSPSPQLPNHCLANSGTTYGSYETDELIVTVEKEHQSCTHPIKVMRKKQLGRKFRVSESLQVTSPQTIMR